ncbi:MAG: glutaminase, partial [Kocuria sp.]|nr:glutaminase [Kocuria sp.]
MESPVRKYLHQLFNDTTAMDGGNLADYIPELAKADPEVFSIALTTIDGRTYSVGDDEREFTIQSISKPFAYASALTDRGLEAISAKVGVEPTGEAFNELSLEKGTNRPKNPMINAGAITIHSMLAEPDSSLEDRANHTEEFF